MTKRNIVEIDEDKCDGCGLCATACAEKAIEIVDGKARLISDSYCDGLGACLGECPQDAITIEERDVEPFDEKAVESHIHAQKHTSAGCPGAKVMQFEKKESGKDSSSNRIATQSELSQWPIKIRLVPPQAPYLNNASLLIAADCTPFSFADFHSDLLKEKTVLIGCPKFDDAQFYLDKLTQIFQANDIKDITIVHMEVPCCFGFVPMVNAALQKAGKDIPVEDITISIKGDKQ